MDDTIPARSPAASGKTSPTSTQHINTLELTPTSKIKAMLAAIDDESGSDTPYGLRSARNAATDRPASVQDRIEETRCALHEDDGSSSEDVFPTAPAPRGKLAARLQGNNVQAVGKSPNDSSDKDAAYARLKKKLASRIDRSPTKEKSLSSARVSSETDEDEIMPTVTKRRRTLPQETSVELQPRPASTSPQPPSPGLFITPEKEQGSKPTVSPDFSTNLDQRPDSDSDLPVDPQANSRFLGLVARKREERLAKEAEAKEKARVRELAREELQGQKKKTRKQIRMSDDDSEGSGAEKLTQHVRPTRKASKKALEEMNRETQRMSRNMQLAHQARTKKKITKESLFARFNFRIGSLPAPAEPPANSSSAAASSDLCSETEARLGAESPPTSPLSPGDETLKHAKHYSKLTGTMNTNSKEQQTSMGDGDLPAVQDVITMSQERLDEGKGRNIQDRKIEHVSVVKGAPKKAQDILKNAIRIRASKPTASHGLAGGSNSDLEILPTKKSTRKIDAIFDRLPASKAREGHSLQTLRALAHLTSPNKPSSGTKAGISLSEMQNSLQKRARQQAARERAEKIQELRDRGVIIQTAEERQKDQAEVEDLLEKARRDAVDLKKKEKDKAKKEAKANGEAAPDDTSEDDEDYQENDADESEVELSGSDEEGENQLFSGGEGESENGIDGAQEDEEAEVQLGNEGLIEDEASEDSEEDADENNPNDEATNEEDEASNVEDEEHNSLPARRRNKRIIDDEGDEDDEEIQQDQTTKVPPTEVAIPQFGNFGLPNFAGAPMDMSQAFAATMADSQTQGDGRHGGGEQEEDSLAFLGPPPEPEFPELDMEDSQMIVDSQGMNDSNLESQAKISLHFTQSQMGMNSLDDTAAGPSATQFSEIPDPTQDVGFALSSPVAGRFASIPPSTVDTVILPQADDPDSPVVKKKGRLRRRTDSALEDESDATANAVGEQNDMSISANAFDVLRKGSKKSSDTIQDFDRTKSKAQEMVEEQAQESEDEYAGLGGASDDESHGEEDEEVRKMIEQGDVDVDERQLAAFYADKERASDEKAVEKLFKDINNGMLRRKRGADFDLSDSDDDVEARRRRKRREFAKMRKALLENENVGKIAEDPKKVAFLRAIEDREGDEDLDFLEQPDESSQPAMVADSQEIPDSQRRKEADETSAPALCKRKRPLVESAPDTTNRPPSAARRTATMKKPLSLAEIRASVSFLVEEPDAMPVAPPSSSPVASDNENDVNDNTHLQIAMNPPSLNNTDNNKTNAFTCRRRTNPVIDRLSLKRESSSLSTSSHLAFHNPSNSTAPTFKVPSLLRRATTSSFNTSQDSHGISTLAETERSAGGAEKGDFVRRGGTKRSSVNFAAARVVKGVEDRVKEGVRRMVRREGSSLSGLGGGSFE
ncbi:MAG: hypothetical protein Q9166_006001 [cf. Caloplaca sp. 2 TL-2023]